MNRTLAPSWSNWRPAVPAAHNIFPGESQTKVRDASSLPHSSLSIQGVWIPMFARRASTLLLFSAAFLLRHSASAQVLYGSLTGTVSDTSGGAVASAHIEALNTSTG